ncbi:hypothetical protein Tco_0748583 [Tanacetum coccineum]|uniref:Uncharacterized protein n=1 Tax=Tanacetum coccineum TaxID=301880 RepID=A0ABQ4YYR7_9ASTR
MAISAVGIQDNGGFSSIYLVFTLNDPKGRNSSLRLRFRNLVLSGCSRSMTGNKEKLYDFKYLKGQPKLGLCVAFKYCLNHMKVDMVLWFGPVINKLWHIRIGDLFHYPIVYRIETISGKLVYMFADGSYPLSVQLTKKMLKHKLEIEIDGVGNDMTYAEQLIQFIKNQIAASLSFC